VKTKFGVLDKFKVFKALVEYHIEQNIKVIRCDGNMEYNSKNFNTFFKDYDIVE
jgi:hypothetical protein